MFTCIHWPALDLGIYQTAEYIYLFQMWQMNETAMCEGSCVERACVYKKKKKKRERKQRFHFCPGVISLEVTACPWVDGSLTAAFLMQADGSIHLHNQENNSVLHRGLHPLKLWDNVTDFHGERRRQSTSSSLQRQKAENPKPQRYSTWNGCHNAV